MGHSKRTPALTVGRRRAIRTMLRVPTAIRTGAEGLGGRSRQKSGVLAIEHSRYVSDACPSAPETKRWVAVRTNPGAVAPGP
jgi:hypothetical protein